MNKHRYFTYILASKRNGTLYVGVTGNLAGRIAEHRDALREGFTRKYGVHILVWFEESSDAHDAILREKRIKKWNRVLEAGVDRKCQPGLDGFVYVASLTGFLLSRK